MALRRPRRRHGATVSCPCPRRPCHPGLLAAQLAMEGSTHQQQLCCCRPDGSSEDGSSASSNSSSSSSSSASSRLRAEAAEAQPKPKPVTDEIRRRCQGTKGTWCIDYHTQPEVPARAAPRGNKTCSMDCNKVGTCSALTGLCTCPAGWTGFNCLFPMKRYCTHRYRHAGFEVPKLEANLSAGVGGPHINMFPRGHCGGFVTTLWRPATALATPPTVACPHPSMHHTMPADAPGPAAGPGVPAQQAAGWDRHCVGDCGPSPAVGAPGLVQRGEATAPVPLLPGRVGRRVL
ncbi:hypothetical protein ABPG75_009272 [Micractinium tetrahymenae]